MTNNSYLITGASRGIGEALAQEAARRRGVLHLVQRSLDPRLKADLLELGAPEVHHWEIDLSQPTALAPFVERFLTEGHSVDVLINNAGQLTGGLLEEQDLNGIFQMLQVNVMAVIGLTRLFLPHFLKRKSGVIVNNASVSGQMFFPCASTYAASKAGVVAFTESMRQELAGTGVRTLLLFTPGVKTQMYDDIARLYGGHLDLSFLSSISAEEWAKGVFKALDSQDERLLPSGSSRAGLWVAKHWPFLFENLVKSKFKRNL